MESDRSLDINYRWQRRLVAGRRTITSAANAVSSVSFFLFWCFALTLVLNISLARV
jgi:hypothetical protein